MAKKVAASHNLTNGGTSMREILYGGLPFETLRAQVGIVLTGKDLVSNILGLTPQEQTKFLDKVDQVGLSLPSSLLKSSIHLFFFYKGIPYFRLAKCEVYLRPGERMQRSSAASDLSCALHGTRETWYDGGGFRRSDRRLEGRFG